MRIYLDASILVVLIFGKDREPVRFRAVNELFKKINADEVEGVLSFYALHEFFTFCKNHFMKEKRKKAIRMYPITGGINREVIAIKLTRI